VIVVPAYTRAAAGICGIWQEAEWIPGQFRTGDKKNKLRNEWT
jgi:hypothetical protein